MKAVTMHKAKSQLSQLVADVEAGEEVIILRNTEPVARLVPIAEVLPQRKFGALAGLVLVPDSFFEQLPDDELASWDR